MTNRINKAGNTRIFLTLGLIWAAMDAGACTVPVFRYALDRWPGKTAENAVESPIFWEIADRILAGDSAVWIQVDSGDKTADDAAFERLEARLKFFESVAELPEIDPNDPSSQLGPGPELTLKFSTLRLKRDDPAVEQIAGPEVDALPADEAWIAPVFGRGRVLGAWQASLMDEEGIDEACFYLTGACSCQVKAQNPGWDLVMNVDWDARLLEAEDAALSERPPEPNHPNQPGQSVSAEKSPPALETVVFGAPEVVSSSVRSPSRVWAGVLFLLTGGAAVFFANFQRKPAS